MDGRADVVWSSLRHMMNLEMSAPYFFRPTDSSWLHCRYHGVHMIVTFRDPTNSGDTRPAVVVVRMLTLNRNFVDQFVDEVRTLYQKSRSGLEVWTHSQTRDDGAEWESLCTAAKRSIDTLILDEAIKAGSLGDVREFLSDESKQWYKDNGIPYHRGYLFFGVPGSGKTSLVHCIASELERDLCVVTLSAVNDVSLPKLLGSMPDNAVVIMEDIDVALKNSMMVQSRELKPQGHSSFNASSEGSLTLSGLLNAIDGVTSQSGRILFVTTNDRAALDPALTRAGRLDVHIEFFCAKSEQAAQLFRQFYAVKAQDDALFSSDEIEKLALRFAQAIPDDTFPMAQLQGYLMAHKRNPQSACDGVIEWVSDEQAKLKQFKVEVAGRLKLETEANGSAHGDRPTLVRGSREGHLSSD